MSKGYDVPPPYGPPPAAPPSYAQAVGGVPPTAPYIPTYHRKYILKKMHRKTKNALCHYYGSRPYMSPP